MSNHFDTVTIVGVGLLGGSLGLALKELGLAKRVLGVGRRPETLQVARDRGAIDAIAESLGDAVAQADLVVLCTPPASVPQYLDTIRPYCGLRTTVTDVASTKEEICRHVRRAWADPYRFVGSHPMAGSEKYGPEYASADLFAGSVCFVEARDGHAADAYDTVVRLWESVGAHVVPVDPAEHDWFVARTSHVPHVFAAALARLAEGDPRLRPFAGRGYRDMTRIAEGRPEIWRDICLTNRAAIAAALAEARTTLDAVLHAIEKNDAAALEQFFEEGRASRRGLLGE